LQISVNNDAVAGFRCAGMPEAPVIPLRGPCASAPLAEREDDELMLLVRAGERAAMAVLVERYHARLVSFCAKLTVDAAVGEELTQETFLRLWRQRGHYRAEGKLAVLLYTTARNLCRNHRRSWRRRLRWFAPGAPPEEPSAPAQSVGAVDAILERERQRDIQLAIAELSGKLREALVLRFEHGLPYDQIATIVGTNESTARSRVHLGLAELRARLAGGDR
jgi:RNA polymerase sigma-70 factor (ECF subfamily)